MRKRTNGKHGAWIVGYFMGGYYSRGGTPRSQVFAFEAERTKHWVYTYTHYSYSSEASLRWPCKADDRPATHVSISYNAISCSRARFVNIVPMRSRSASPTPSGLCLFLRVCSFNTPNPELVAVKIEVASEDAFGQNPSIVTPNAVLHKFFRFFVALFRG
jgi:hypothetical protein